MFAKIAGMPPCCNEELRETGQHCVHFHYGKEVCCQCGASPNPLLAAMQKAVEDTSGRQE